MSLKAWLRKVLDVKPIVITRTTFVYPTTNEEDAVASVLMNFDKWFHFSNVSGYSSGHYESDIYKCAADLLGPSKAQEVVEGIKNKWGIGQFFCHNVPEGKVVVDYINAEPKMLKQFHSFHRTQKKNCDLSERQFKALESLENQLLDLKLVQFELAEDVESLLEFVKKFTKTKVEDKKEEMKED